MRMNHDATIVALTKSQACFKPTGDRSGAASTLRSLGTLYHKQRNPSAAIAGLDVEASVSTGDLLSTAHSLK